MAISLQKLRKKPLSLCRKLRGLLCLIKLLFLSSLWCMTAALMTIPRLTTGFLTKITLKMLPAAKFTQPWPEELLRLMFLWLFLSLWTEFSRNGTGAGAKFHDYFFNCLWPKIRLSKKYISRNFERCWRCFFNFHHKTRHSAAAFHAILRRNKCYLPGLAFTVGIKNFGEQGEDYINILRRYYGSEIYLESATEVTGIPISFPGETLGVGLAATLSEQFKGSLIQ